MEPVDSMDAFATFTGNFETCYAEQGSGQPVVLLHGWGASKRIWRYLWPELVPRFRTIAPDLPGWGASEKPKGAYTPEWYADWLGAFLEARFASPVDIVAHSMATMAAVVFAARHPEKVGRLVLSNPPVFGKTAFPWRTRALTTPGVSRLVYPLKPTHCFRKFIAKDFTYIVPWDDVDLDLLKCSTYSSMIYSVRGMVSSDVRPYLSSIRSETLVISSRRDAVIRPGQAELAVAGLKSPHHVALEEVGHCPMIERPEEFNRVVLDFLTRDRVKERPQGW